MTGTRMDPAPPQNGSGPLYYRGHYNIEAQLDHMVKTQALDKYTEIILSGCSAGGACRHSTRTAPRGGRDGGFAVLFNADMRSTLMVLLAFQRHGMLCEM